MRQSILILPIGGSASRMQGLPKFLLPFDAGALLIEKHIKAALESGFSQIVVIVRDSFFELTSLYLSEYDSRVQIVKLEEQTKTMCETLLFGMSKREFSPNDQIVVALADTAFESKQYQDIYSTAAEIRDDPFLVLFRTADEQFGRLGQVEMDILGNVVAMQDKVVGCTLPNFWGIAAFPYHLIEYIESADAHIGISFQRWLQRGQIVKGIPVKSLYFDCGTFDEYRRFMISQEKYLE